MINPSNSTHTSNIFFLSFQVLTANIGTLLDLYGVEKGLDHFKSSQELTFDEFRYYLQHEVFSSLPKSATLPIVRDYEKKISEVGLLLLILHIACW